MNKYVPVDVEESARKKWALNNLYKVDLNDKRPKFYLLVEFTYPSGDLHMGHWFTFAVPDILARKKRMQGFNVFAPNGFDAFGLPAENAAIKNKIHPKDWTYSNIEKMKSQFDTMGASYDWEHQVISCDVEYYKWNQWIFLKMFEKGLAYKGKVLSNWCPTDQTVLANENVENGKCWRCGTDVVRKEVEQWFFKITDYADKLIWSEKPDVDWPKPVRVAQNNWIGKSEGIEIKFKVHSTQYRDEIVVFTKFPETIFGVTYMVLAPEHKLVSKITTPDQKNEVSEYAHKSQKKSELERMSLEKEKTGVFTGSYAINPVNNQKVPIWISDYVIASYGTGAVMGVPGSDFRDFEFAKKFDLPIVRVIGSKPGDQSEVKTDNDVLEEGYIVNSGQFDGLEAPKVAREKVMDYLEEKGWGSRKVNYHLHDWSISRQRYWGAPIPIIYCDNCGTVPVEEKDLPVELPYDVDFAPHGKPPLATAEDWVNVKCPKCGGNAKREVETMDTFVDSSWYFLRYLRNIKENAKHQTPNSNFQIPNAKQAKNFNSLKKQSPTEDKKSIQAKGQALDLVIVGKKPGLEEEFAWGKEIVKDWMPIDTYFGGSEHTLGHTLYSRFFVKFLQDIDELPSFGEYAKKRVHHGVILGPDGARMSKSKGNVVNPDEQVKRYGADAVRLYLAFLGPYDLVAPWNSSGVNGVFNFLQRVWRLFERVEIETGPVSSFPPVSARSDRKENVDKEDNPDLRAAESPSRTTTLLDVVDLQMMHKTIKKVGDDIEAIKFNTAVSALMEWLNFLEKRESKLKTQNSKLKNNEKSQALVKMIDGKKPDFTVSRLEYTTLLLLLAPFAPHMTEELWQVINDKQETRNNKLDKFKSIHLEKWPEYDESLIASDKITLIVQVNGKLRDKIEVERGISKEKAEKIALASEKVSKYISKSDKNIKTIFVADKLINFVSS